MSVDAQHLPSPVELVLASYFHAKDCNRPHLLKRVFASDARLEVRNASAAIAFPAVTVGLEEIAEVFVREFGRTNENVYSFYLAKPVGPVRQFSCPWLVGMTAKQDKSVRVGCGKYEWSFVYEPTLCATELVISIEVMQVLSSSAQTQVLAWLEQLARPWSSADAIVRTAPALEELAPVLNYLGCHGQQR